MSWCFAVINNRLAEIYFDHDKKRNVLFWAHAYVDKTKNWTKREKQHIKKDTQKYKFSYHNGYYRDKKKNIKFKRITPAWMRSSRKLVKLDKFLD